MPGTSPFDRLANLASNISSREHTQASTYLVEQERQQNRKRYQQMHSQAMGTFARVDLMLNKLHHGGRFG